jgi:hypothetical protein
MITAILTHEVKSYPEWRVVFDSDEERRLKAGIRMKKVYQSVDNPNKITMIGKASSLEAFQSFMSNPELKEKMEMGGVISMPEVRFVNRAK